MISSDMFLLATLVFWLAFLLAVGIVERRDHATFYTRDRRVRYRRLSTGETLARLRKQRR